MYQMSGKERESLCSTRFINISRTRRACMIYLYIALAVFFAVMFVVGGAREEMKRFNSIAEAHSLRIEKEDEH